MLQPGQDGESVQETTETPSLKETKKKPKKKTSPAEESVQESAVHPVTCSVCSTIVAVYDSEEIYHFFNVLASEA